MKEPIMIVRNKEGLKTLFPLDTSIEDIKSKLGENTNVIKIDNFKFNLIKPQSLEDFKIGLDKYKILLNIMSEKDIKILSVYLSFDDLIKLDIAKSEFIEKDLSDKELVFKYIEFAYQINMYDFNQKYIDILDECVNYKLFKEDLLSENKIIKLDNVYFFSYIKDDILEFI